MSEPIVAIVGRPNVGKSTFFNRLIGKRQAIVDDKPGVTRDRNYGHAEWCGQQFMLIDTGGYLPTSTNIMDLAIREQVDIAMAEADLLVFVVDAQTGITEIDEQIAGMLRRSEKKVLVAVNKVDDDRLEPEVGQFYNLGLDEPHSVSAMKGRTVGDFLDVMVKYLNEFSPRDEDFDGIKLAVIGKENVGKSSLVNTFLNQTRSIVTNIPGTTRDSIDSVLKYKHRNYLLIDTAGLKKKAKVKENILFYSNLRTFRSIQRADVILYMVDIKEGLSRQDVFLLNEATQQHKGVVLILNKWDLIEKDDKTVNEYTLDIVERLGVMRYIPLIFTSVLTKQRLYKALDLATEVYENLQKKISTADLNNYFAPIIHETTPPATKGKEIKINYITQIRTGFPLFAFYSNHPNLITENYRRFLENKLRERYDFSGVPVILSFRNKNPERTKAQKNVE
ncbi:MAG: ribosome biogenesis GTPase Der [Calditrichaeota bacterium]|nr:ribosome biogenesis GTPase Der [Calditrichota bacterium]